MGIGMKKKYCIAYVDFKKTRSEYILIYICIIIRLSSYVVIFSKFARQKTIFDNNIA